MGIALGLIALAGFAYFVYRQMSKPTGWSLMGWGGKPDDHSRPDKK